VADRKVPQRQFTGVAGAMATKTIMKKARLEKKTV